MGGSAGVGTAVSPGFVGRSADVEILRQAVDGAVAGSGSLALLAGEPGIGKTRLAEEVAAYAEQAGMAVRRAAGWEGDGAPAYWPWIQIVRAHAAERDPQALATELGRYAEDVVRLVPEVSEALPSSPKATTERIGEQPRFRLFDAVTSFIRRAAAAQPLLLVLDDLHWADVGSVMLLRFCARELRGTRVLVLGAYRDFEVDPSSELGRALAAVQARAQTLVLGGLGPQDVRELLAQAVGHHEAERMAPDVHRRSGGNPLFVQELGRLLTATGRPGLGVAPSIPDSIRAVLERRLSRLSAECLGLLVVGAAAGEEVRLDVLERVSGHPREVVLDLLDGAMRARLLREAEGGRAQFAFAHALIRDALYDRLTLAERAELHRRIGEALEQATGTDPPVAELAHHFLKATLGPSDTRPVDYAERAGRESFDRLAFEDAAAHFARALDALRPGGVEDDRRARLLLSLGDARVWAGDVPGAREAFEEAAALARRRAQPELLAEAALGFGAALGGFEVRLFDRAQVDLLEEALGALGTTDSPLRARALALLSVALTFTESPERRLQLAEEGVATARRVGDAAALVHALGAHCDAISGPDHSELRLTQSTEMVGVAQEAGDRCMELLGRRHRLVALLELGDIRGVDAEMEAYAATAESVRQPLYLWYVPMWRAMRALMNGRLEECRELTEEVSRIGVQAHSDNAALLAEVLRWQRLHVEGRMREGAEVLREQLKLTQGVPADSFWIGLCFPTEYPEEAKAALARVVPNDFAEFQRDAIWLAAMGGVVEACDVVRDASVAERAYEILLPYCDRFALDGTATACYGSVSRYLGILAGILGRFDAAADHFERALEANRRAGAAALVARTLHEYGAKLLEAGEKARAEAVLSEAIAGYSELGMGIRAQESERLLSVLPKAVEPSTNTFHRDGDVWTMTFDGRTAQLKDAKGLRDIATLIAQQGRDVHVADLIAATEGAPRPPAVITAHEEVSATTESSEPILDERARAAYRERLDELREELEEAERFSDVGRAERAREEMDIVAGELASALGLGGRARRTGSPGERARKAVAQRVRNALRRIEAEHPVLAKHLDRSLRMGSFCSYAPERRADWRL